MKGLQLSADLGTIDEEEEAQLACPLPPGLPIPSFEGRSQRVEAPDPSFSSLNPLDYFDEHKLVPTDRGTFSVYTGGKQNVMAYVFIHGAGYSALSFAEVVKFLKNEAFCVSVDLRGHGNSRPGELDFEEIVADVNCVLDAVFVEKMSAVLFGHSLGGSVITATNPNKLKIEAMVLIDISEVVAIEALPNMQTFLRKKPRTYDNCEEMAQWLYRNHELLRKTPCRIQAQGMITEDGGLISDLIGSEGYWENWFSGLNERFLRDEKVWKMLLVSTMGKLDRDLEIAHMRGKMNVDVVRGCVHNLHEDNPVGFLGIVTRFLRRLHLNDKLYNMPFDFKRPLLDAEKEASEEQLRAFFPE